MKRFLFRRKTITLSIGITLLTLSLAAMAFSQALAITTNDFVPFGELVLVEGTLHLQQHITINNNRVTIKTHAQPQGADGVGQTTGDLYQAVGVTQEVDTLPLIGGATEFTFVNNFRLIGQKTDNNFQVHQNVHVTINANGDVTNTIVNETIDCN